MIQRVSEFVPFGAPASPVPRIEGRLLADLLKTSTPRAGSDDALLDMLQRSFSVAMLDALSQRHQATVARAAVATPSPATPPASPPSAPTTASSAAAPTPATRAPGRSPALPVDEQATITAAAARASIDPSFLAALRRTENGGPGREFGVLSVPAPTYREQARVAAESVRRNVERFEAAGGRAVDPVSGKYTTEFIEFFSRRYAPVGASNDPQNLNQYHARNLIRLYAQVAPRA